MKKLYFLTFLFMLVFILCGGHIIAQDVIDEPVNDWMEIINQLIGEFFITSIAFSTLVTTVASYVIKLVNKDDKPLSKFAKQSISLGISIVFGLVGYFLNLGIFADVTLAGAVYTIITISFGANGIWDWFKGLTSGRKKDK